MRRVPIDTIKDGDILAKDIYSSSGVSLMSEGTILKTTYIQRMADLHIEFVFVKDLDDETDIATEIIIEERLKEHCAETIKNTLQVYSYAGNDELKKLVEVANDIITDVLSEPHIMYNVSCIRDKSNELYAHSLNVCALSTLIAVRAKLPKEKVREIAIGALLHDIGFTTLGFDTNDLILEECDEQQKKEIIRHVVYGYSDVEKKDWITKAMKDIVVHHHERLDGSGYPLHMKGESISPEVRIVSLCDQFDSMVYGRLMPKFKVRDAMDYIMSQAGAQFDFHLVQLFFESVAAYPIGTTVSTNEGDTAVVLRQNYKFPTRPIIRLIKNKQGEAYTTYEERDLTKYLTLFILDTLDE